LSRLASSRGSSASSTSTRSAATRRPGGVLVQSPKSDIYVALLGVSLGAILLGCLLLILAWSKYGFSTKVSANSSTVQTTMIV
jgi:hypothetical protein